MNLIVIGCGRVGSELANRLFKQGHKVCVVDQNDKTFLNLPVDFRGRTLEGDAMNQIVLRRAGVETADGVAVVTSSDMINAVVGHVLQTYYKVPMVVVRCFDPSNHTIYEAFNLQVVSPSTWGAQRIEELLYSHKVRMVYSAGNGEIELYELTVPSGWEDRYLGELFSTQGCRPASLTRAGKALLPELDMQLRVGDQILVSATLEAIDIIRRKLESPQEV